MRRVFVTVSVLAMVVVEGSVLSPFISAPALANPISREDPYDTPESRIDLAQVTVTHSGSSHIFALRLHTVLDTSYVDGTRGWFQIDIDTDGDKVRNHWLVIAYSDGWRGFVFHKRTDTWARLRAWELHGSYKIEVPLSKLGNPESYDFVARAVYRRESCSASDPCVDSIPNVSWIRHDFTPPPVAWVTLPDLSTDVSADLTIPVRFVASDDEYGSGLQDWVLERRLAGTHEWGRLARGTSETPSVTMNVKPGRTYQLRVRATDRQGNSSSIDGEVTVPFDDSGSSIDYVGDWVAEVGVAHAFLGTLHEGASGTLLSLVVEGGSGGRLCVIGGPTSESRAHANLYVGGSLVSEIREGRRTQPRSVVACSPIPAGDGPVDVELVPTSSEPFVLDGIAVKP